MRSSIACARCRRSKVKCMNAGINTKCRACDAAGRECTYPAPAATGQGAASVRTAGIHARLPNGLGANGESPKRQRTKKSLTSAPTSTTPRGSPRALIDALDPHILTPKVWSEVFDIFQSHFSTDLPFLHAPTFLEPLRKSFPGSIDLASPTVDQSPSGSQPQASPLLLLGLLALTARFHRQLSAHHSPPSSIRPTNPSVSSEYYASALRARMGGDGGESLGQPSLERIQALLMLGLHEWGMCKGTKAWILVGIAVRMAQVMGLEFEQELDNEPLAISSALYAEAVHLGVDNSRKGQKGGERAVSESFIEQEIRRRTFWSCFIMDRYLSSGKYRPQMVNVKDLRIQLPSSERAFVFGERVRTSLLGDEIDEGMGRATLQSQRRSSVLHSTGNSQQRKSESQEPLARSARAKVDLDEEVIEEEENKGRLEIGPEEGVLSRVVKIVEIWGRIAKWSCSGGRRTEKHPPWDEKTTFYSLRILLAQFHACLPRQLTFSTANLSAHITSRTSTPYTLMHTIYFLCLIVLHREYVPFLPMRCAKPEGPLDAPVFDREEYDIPVGFWEESAKSCFKSARDIMDLVRTCQDWGVLVETPMVGFAIYTVAFTGIYCINFPQMDPDGYMCDINDGHGAAEARRALEMIGHMRPRLKMADGWFRTIKKMHRYMVKMKKDYHRNAKLLQSSASESDGSPATHRHLSLREGGGGGGLEEYKLLEKTLKDFGSLEDDESDIFNFDGSKRTTADDSSFSEVADTSALKDEGMEGVETVGVPENSKSGQERWIAINSVAAAAAAGRSPDTMEMGPAYPQRNPSTSSYPSYSSQASQQQYFGAPHQPPQPPNQSTNPPSLLSPSIAGSTPSINSPFPRSEASTSAYQSYAPVPGPPVYGSAQPPAEQASRVRTYDPIMNTTSNHPREVPPVTQVQAQQGQLQTQPTLQSQQAAIWKQENWFNGISTRLGGDDVAAFMNGTSWEDWPNSYPANNTAGNGSWFQTLWNGAPGTGTMG
ncbi:MAG: ATPase synthesis protein 25 mitochondrial [Chaenotheca gracillima]|nr:MAG: ATPase synthesis protein 25 mitochondrial [Chaenotheca gracillima]